MRPFLPATSMQLAVLFLVVTIGVGTLRSDDNETAIFQPTLTLASKLANARHISLSRDDTSVAYSIRVFTPEQQRRNLERLGQAATELATTDDLIKSLHARAKAAKDSNAPFAEQKVIAQQLADATSSFARRSAPPAPFFYYRVLSVGQDFIELQPESGRGTPGATVIISLRYVHRISIEPTEGPVATTK